MDTSSLFKPVNNERNPYMIEPNNTERSQQRGTQAGVDESFAILEEKAVADLTRKRPQHHITNSYTTTASVGGSDSQTSLKHSDKGWESLPVGQAPPRVSSNTSLHNPIAYPMKAFKSVTNSGCHSIPMPSQAKHQPNSYHQQLFDETFMGTTSPVLFKGKQAAVPTHHSIVPRQCLRPTSNVLYQRRQRRSLPADTLGKRQQQPNMHYVTQVVPRNIQQNKTKSNGCSTTESATPATNGGAWSTNGHEMPQYRGTNSSSGLSTSVLDTRSSRDERQQVIDLTYTDEDEDDQEEKEQATKKPRLEHNSDGTNSLDPQSDNGDNLSGSIESTEKLHPFDPAHPDAQIQNNKHKSQRLLLQKDTKANNLAGYQRRVVQLAGISTEGAASDTTAQLKQPETNRLITNGGEDYSVKGSTDSNKNATQKSRMVIRLLRKRLEEAKRKKLEIEDQLHQSRESVVAQTESGGMGAQREKLPLKRTASQMLEPITALQTSLVISNISQTGPEDTVRFPVVETDLQPESNEPNEEDEEDSVSPVAEALAARKSQLQQDLNSLRQRLDRKQKAVERRQIQESNKQDEPDEAGPLLESGKEAKKSISKEDLEKRRQEAQTQMDVSYWNHYVSKQQHLLSDVRAKVDDNAAVLDECKQRLDETNDRLQKTNVQISDLEARQKAISDMLTKASSKLLDSRNRLHEEKQKKKKSSQL